jgi:succinate dehydrogenase / fumarate reductase cytochrome b subunit
VVHSVKANRMATMQKTLTLYDTTIGKKAVMAITGIVWFGFVIGHMIGNLQVFLGPEALNDYARKLRDLAPLLWVARIVLATTFVLHVVAAFQLWQQSRQARPVAYSAREYAASNYASLTMMLSGPMILLFIAYHLAHFTVPGVAMSAGYEHSHADVYANVVNGFSVPWVSGLYILAQLFLGLHLFHGGQSLIQTLGFNHPRYVGRPRFVVRAVTALVVLGNVFIPLAVLAGVIK